MNSLKAFLSSCVQVNTESGVRTDNLTVVLQNGQPVLVFDRNQQSQPFVVVSVADLESLTQDDVAVLTIIAEQSQWSVIVDGTNQVRGIIEPQRMKDLRIAATATTERDEFGGKITDPLISPISVSVSFYGCPKHPEVGRFALHAVGAPIPRCPKDGEAMVELEKRGEHADTKSHAPMDGGKKGWFVQLFSWKRKA